MSRTMSRFAVALLVISLVAAACGDDDSTEPSDTDIATAEYLAFRDQPVACDGALPPSAQSMQFDAPDDMGITGVVTAIIHTSCGDVTIELDPASAPAAVNSFVFLAEQGYFDGTASHRVYPGFMIQVGDPTATGRGGPGYTIPDEYPPAGFSYEPGVVAMANTGRPDSAGSQFFMMLAQYPLPPTYSVFGHVVDGMDVLGRIAQVPLTARGGNPEVSSPLESVFVESIEIRR